MSHAFARNRGLLFRSHLAHGVAVCLALSTFTGCGQPKELREMGFQGPTPAVPQSAAIAAFMSPQGLTSLYMSFDELARSTTATRGAVNNAKFVELYEAFKNDPIPKGFDTDERKGDKQKLVEAIDALIDGAKKKVPDQEFRKLAEPVRPAAEAFMRPTNY